MRGPALALALLVPSVALADMRTGEVAGFLDGFERAVIDQNIVPFMLPFAHPAIAQAQAAAVGMDVDRMNAAALEGYEYTTSLSTIDVFEIDRSLLRNGSAQGVDFVTLPYLLDISLDGYPDLPATCNTLAIWSEDGTLYAHVFGHPRSDALVRQVLPHAGVMMASAMPCNAGTS